MSEIQDEYVPHEDAHAKATDAQLERTSDHPAIPDLPAPGSAYSQAEATAAVNTVNGILDVLRDAGLIPTT